MVYLLLTDIRYNNQVLKTGDTSELKELDNIKQLLEAKVIVPYTKTEVVKQAVKKLEDKTVTVEEVVEDTKKVVEAEKELKAEVDDTGISVEGNAKEPIDVKKSGRGRSKK